MKSFKVKVSLLVFIAFLLGCNEFIMVGITNDIASSYAVSLSTVGFLVTAFAVSYVMCTIVLTVFTANYDRFNVYIVSLIIFLIGNILSAMAPNYLTLFLSRVLTAMVAGIIISFSLIFGNTVAPIEQGSMTVAAIYSGFNIATIVGVPVGTFLAKQYNWRICFWIISILTLVSIIFSWCLLPHHNGKQKVTLKSQIILFKDYRIILGIIIIISTYASQYSFYTYIQPIIVNILTFSTYALNYLLSVIGVTFIIGNLLAGVISSKYEVKKMTKIEALATFFFALLPLSFHFSWVGILCICLICIMLGMPSSILQVMFLNIAHSQYPQSLNVSSSIDPLCTNIGVSVGSLFASLFINHFPMTNIGYLGFCFSLCGLFASFFLTSHFLQSQRS